MCFRTKNIAPKDCTIRNKNDVLKTINQLSGSMAQTLGMSQVCYPFKLQHPIQFQFTYNIKSEVIVNIELYVPSPAK